jgi:hypothetical protein
MSLADGLALDPAEEAMVMGRPYVHGYQNEYGQPSQPGWWGGVQEAAKEGSGPPPVIGGSGVGWVAPGTLPDPSDMGGPVTAAQAQAINAAYNESQAAGKSMPARSVILKDIPPSVGAADYASYINQKYNRDTAAATEAQTIEVLKRAGLPTGYTTLPNGTVINNVTGETMGVGPTYVNTPGGIVTLPQANTTQNQIAQNLALSMSASVGTENWWRQQVYNREIIAKLNTSKNPLSERTYGYFEYVAPTFAVGSDAWYNQIMQARTLEPAGLVANTNLSDKQMAYWMDRVKTLNLEFKKPVITPSKEQTKLSLDAIEEIRLKSGFSTDLMEMYYPIKYESNASPGVSWDMLEAVNPTLQLGNPKAPSYFDVMSQESPLIGVFYNLAKFVDDQNIWISPIQKNLKPITDKISNMLSLVGISTKMQLTDTAFKVGGYWETSHDAQLQGAHATDMYNKAVGGGLITKSQNDNIPAGIFVGTSEQYSTLVSAINLAKNEDVLAKTQFQEFEINPSTLHPISKGISQWSTDVGEDFKNALDIDINYLRSSSIFPMVGGALPQDSIFKSAVPIGQSGVNFFGRAIGFLPASLISLPLIVPAVNAYAVNPKALPGGLIGGGAQFTEGFINMARTDPAGFAGEITGMLVSPKLIKGIAEVGGKVVNWNTFNIPIETPPGLPKTEIGAAGYSTVATKIIENGIETPTPEGLSGAQPVKLPERNYPISYSAVYKGLSIDWQPVMRFLGQQVGSEYSGKQSIFGYGLEPAVKGEGTIPGTSTKFLGLWWGEKAPAKFGTAIESQVTGSVNVLQESTPMGLALQKLNTLEALKVASEDLAYTKSIMTLRELTDKYPSLMEQINPYGDTKPLAFVNPDTLTKLNDYANLHSAEMRYYGSLVGRVYGIGDVLGDWDVLINAKTFSTRAQNLFEIFLDTEYGAGKWEVKTSGMEGITRNEAGKIIPVVNSKSIATDILTGERLGEMSTAKSAITGTRIIVEGKVPRVHALDLHPANAAHGLPVFNAEIPGTNVKSIPGPMWIYGIGTIPAESGIGTLILGKTGSDVMVETSGRVKDAIRASQISNRLAANAILNPGIPESVVGRLDLVAKIMGERISAVSLDEPIHGYAPGFTVRDMIGGYVNPLEEPAVIAARSARNIPTMTKFFSGVPYNFDDSKKVSLAKENAKMSVSWEELQRARGSNTLIELPSGQRINPWNIEDILKPEYTQDMGPNQEFAIARNLKSGEIIKIYSGIEGEGSVMIPGEEVVGMDVIHTHPAEIGHRFVSDVVSPEDIAGTLWGTGDKGAWLNPNFKMGAVLHDPLTNQKIGTIENIIRGKSISTESAKTWLQSFYEKYYGYTKGETDISLERVMTEPDYARNVESAPGAKSTERLFNYIKSDIGLEQFASSDFDIIKYQENNPKYSSLVGKEYANSIREVEAQLARGAEIPFEIQRMKFIADERGIHIIEDRRIGTIQDSIFGKRSSIRGNDIYSNLEVVKGLENQFETVSSIVSMDAPKFKTDVGSQSTRHGTKFYSGFPVEVSLKDTLIDFSEYVKAAPAPILPYYPAIRTPVSQSYYMSSLASGKNLGGYSPSTYSDRTYNPNFYDSIFGGYDSKPYSPPSDYVQYKPTISNPPYTPVGTLPYNQPPYTPPSNPIYNILYNPPNTPPPPTTTNNPPPGTPRNPPTTRIWPWEERKEILHKKKRKPQSSIIFREILPVITPIEELGGFKQGKAFFRAIGNQQILEVKPQKKDYLHWVDVDQDVREMQQKESQNKVSDMTGMNFFRTSTKQEKAKTGKAIQTYTPTQQELNMAKLIGIRNNKAKKGRRAPWF